jgi:biopolymer transport protein ExbB
MSLLDAFLNPVVWCILALALTVYAWLIDLILDAPRDQTWHTKASAAMPTLNTLVSILPLLGLLGTIIGLLDVFHEMSIERGLDPTTLVSGGIADAMFTTQIGLLMVIPSWLALSYLQAKISDAGST